MARKFPEAVSGYELNLGELPLELSGAVLWNSVFGASRALRIEVGVGNSPFLIQVSLRSPGFNYLGFEYSKKRVLKFLKKVEAAKVTNIRILRLNACLALPRLFLPESVDHFYINHPDPWPKRRHGKNRFVAPANMETLRKLLRPAGGISLRTDSAPYAKQMLEVLDGTEGLTNLAGKGAVMPKPLEDFSTPYEAKFRKEGREIFYLEYVKRGSQGTMKEDGKSPPSSALFDDS
jgi:tRNA (guanine-N7-)-methyltransferase